MTPDGGARPARGGGSPPRPVLWVICGAGRGVGKTRLALGLCGVLPDAAYAKQGTSRRRDDKPASFFHDDGDLDAFLAAQTAAGRRHLVVESNALARRGRGDLIIYLSADGPSSGPRGPRPDAPQLQAAAHIVLGHPGSAAGATEPAAASGTPGVAARSPALEPAGTRGEGWAEDWRRHLTRMGLDRSVTQDVLSLLADQDAWNSGGG